MSSISGMPDSAPESPEPDPALVQAVEAQMRLLRVRYLEKMAETVAALNEGLIQSRSAAFGVEEREIMRRMAHKLAGTGATYGFGNISAAGRRIDDLLKADPMASAAALTPMIADLTAACQAAIDNALPQLKQPSAEPQPALQALGQTFGRRGVADALTPNASPARKPVMLVVDDDEAIRTLFSGMFAADAEVVTAIDTVQALSLMRLYRPDVVLLDDIMPDCISGLRLLEDMQASGEFAATQVIMVTASDADADRIRGLAAGAVDYITKPFEPEAVARRVRQRLRSASVP